MDDKDISHYATIAAKKIHRQFGWTWDKTEVSVKFDGIDMNSHTPTESERKEWFR